MDQVGLFPVLAVSAVLFVTGVTGVLTRKNALIVFMSVELMLNAVNLSFVALPGRTSRWTVTSSRSS